MADRKWEQTPPPPDDVKAVESVHGTIWVRERNLWRAYGFNGELCTWGVLLCTGAPLVEYHMPPLPEEGHSND